MSRSDDNTNDLESYGVWVKNNNENEEQTTDTTAEGLPDFDDSDFSDMFKDDSQFSTEADSAADAFEEEDSTLSTDELANITGASDISIEEVNADELETETDDDMPDFTEVSVENDDNNPADFEVTEESPVFTDETIPDEDSEPAHDFEESGEITFGEDEEISLDDFMDEGFSDESVAAGNNGFEPGKEPSAAASGDSEEISLDDFLDGDFSASAPAEVQKPQPEEEYIEDKPLEMDINFDDSADTVETEDNISVEVDYSDDDSDEDTSSSIETEEVSLDDFGTSFSSVTDESENTTKSSTPSSSDITTEEVDLSDFGIDASAEETPVTQDVEEAKNKEKVIDYDLSVGDENMATAPVVNEIKDSSPSETPLEQAAAAIPENSTVVENSLLQQIVSDLAGLKDEINKIKTNIAEIKAGEVSFEEKAESAEIPAEEPVIPEDTPVVSGGFFDSDDTDETIALSGDELSNIFNTAEFSETVTEEPAAEENEPVFEESAVEEESPVAEEMPIEEEPVFEESVAEDFTAEEAAPAEEAITEDVIEEPSFEETVTETEVPDFEESISEETPVEETPVVEENPVEETPVVEETPIEENPVEETIIEDTPVFEEPVAEETVEVEEPVIDEPVLDETSVEEPAFEEPESDFAEATEFVTETEESIPEEPSVEEPVFDEAPVEDVPEEDLSFDFENESLTEPDLDSIENEEIDDSETNDLYNDLPDEISIPQQEDLVVESTSADFINSVSDTTEDDSGVQDLPEESIEEVDDDIPTVEKILEDDFADVDIFDGNVAETPANDLTEEATEEEFATTDDLTEIPLEPVAEETLAEEASTEAVSEEVSIEAPVVEEPSFEENEIEEPVIESPAFEEASETEAVAEAPEEDAFAEVDNLDNNISESNLDYLTKKESTPTSDNTAISTDLKQDIKSVLLYMDQLLENLPEEKIIEFAKSDEFVTYKKLFNELGLS